MLLCSVPVLFMYPEHTETDFIEEFVDDQAFEDHLASKFRTNVTIRFVLTSYSKIRRMI